MKLWLLILTLAILISSCRQKTEEIVIEGHLDNAESQMLRLAFIDIDQTLLLDSVKLKDGQYKFALKADNEEDKTRFSSPMLYRLLLNEGSITTMAQGGDHLILDADALNLLGSYHVSGGEEAELIGELDSALNTFVQPTQQLYAIYQENIADDSTREAIERQYVEMLQHHKSYLTQFIEEHPHNMASYIAFYQSYNRRHFFSEEEDFALLKSLTESLKETYPNNPYIKNMLQHVEQLDLVRQKVQE